MLFWWHSLCLKLISPVSSDKKLTAAKCEVSMKRLSTSLRMLGRKSGSSEEFLKALALTKCCPLDRCPTRSRSSTINNLQGLVISGQRTLTVVSRRIRIKSLPSPSCQVSDCLFLKKAWEYWAFPHWHARCPCCKFLRTSQGTTVPENGRHGGRKSSWQD